MDCYSAESEFIESLDFLSPPVKRVHSREAFGSAYHNEANDVHLLRGLRNKFAGRAPSATKNTRTVKTNAESSTSLILKKTSERQILGHYSVVSYTSLQRLERDSCSQRKSDRNPNTVKPLIKVTVIPKSDQIQTAKILRKRRYIQKKTVQSTSSNHENSVQTKNVYLIVAGRRKDKIYEIKTTGSATFSTDHEYSHAKDDEIPVREISNFKHLIHSLNMDKKKRKDNKNASMMNPKVPQNSVIKEQIFPTCDKCFLDDLKAENEDSPKKSRVRIFGQFGISEEDKYILRYGATINDKQVLSDVAQLTRDFSPILVPLAAHDSISDENPERRKDSSIHVHNANKLKNDVNQLPVADVTPSKESQGTQVNFNVQIATTKTGCSNFADKKIQCCCCSVPNRLVQQDHKALKDCQSPLVIISVYPKPSPENSTKSESNSGNNMRSPSPLAIHTYRSSQGLKLDKDTRRNNNETKRNNKTPLVSRSSSPVKTRYSSKNKMQENKPIKSQVNESRSPDRHKALRAIKDKIQEKDKLNQDTTGTRKLPKFNSSNATQVSKNPQNFTISNATQVSNRKQQFYTTSNGTQVSTRDHKDDVVSDATQYFTPVLTASNGTQWVDGPQAVKHSKTVATNKNPRSTKGSTIRPQTAYVSNATQASKCPRQVFATNATQVSNHENTKVSNMTQVSTNEPKFIASRLSKNQETVTSFHAAPIIKREQKLKPLPKLITEKGTNTDHARAKRALIESYTKKLTEQMSNKDYIPTKFDSSRITINIDGDKEYYDVLFNQNKISTDMTIRKTLKDMGSQKFYEEDCSASLENYLFLEDDDAEKGPGPLYTGSKSPTKPTSIALYNQSDNESPLTKCVSRLTIRDSIEISHRREDKSVHDNIKNTQTCFTAQLADSIPDETEFLAPIKHYTGDDCSLCNPIERDKQIRELLGVDNNRFACTKTKQARNCERDDRFPYQCIYRHECKKSQVTEINFQFQKLCPCFKPMHRNQENSSGHTSVSVQCQNPVGYRNSQFNSYAYNVKEESNTDDDADIKSMKIGKCLVNPIRFTDNVNYNDEESQKNYNKCNEDENKNYLSEKKPALYQQLILNRNIQVFLQVEKFSKQKPIILSRKQYNKVKKTIQKTISKKKSSHDKQKKYISNKSQRSEVFVGEVRTKRAKDFKSFKEREAQTDLLVYSKRSCKRDKQRYIFNAQSYKEKNNVKKGSMDNSSPEDTDDSDLEKTRKTDFNKNQSEKKENPDIRVEIKRKGQAVQNVKACTVDQHCGKTTPRNSDQSEQNIVARHGELKVGRVKEQIVPYAKIRNAEIIKQEIGCGSDQLSTQKVERHKVKRKSRSPERYSEVKEYYWPKHYSGQDVEQKFQQYDNGNEDQAVERQEGDIKTLVLFNAENTKGNSKDSREMDNDAPTRKTMSSVEIRYTSAAFMKQVAYSSTDVGALSDSSLAHGNSFHTIFRGHRKSPTPNLGTSVYSLYSEELNPDHKSTKYIMEPRDSKPKKPFLRRLMSCLVMRSTRDSDLKLPIVPLPDVPSVNSSIDSYHISTSLGAMEVSSSIYDTSASFYSNHTILPVNSKIKRGFFSSVRGFLTNRKS